MSEKGLTLYECIDRAQDKFLAIAENTGVNWEQESFFAFDQLTQNSYTMQIANENPDSLRMAMIKVASVGLTLNPATKYAFLVPRDKAIRLDISYQGLLKVATDTGSIMWGKAELVYQGDEFTYKGPAEMPEHHISNPFDERRGKTLNDFEGCYCVAKTHDGDYLVEIMSAAEIDKIRSEAKSMQTDKGKAKSPWTHYPGEMAKKTVIKRASKTWPKTNQHERLQDTVEYLHDSEGSDWDKPHRFKPGEKVEIINQMRKALASGDSFGVLELVQEYDADPRESEEANDESIKFWGLFTSLERNAIRRLLDDNTIEHERQSMDLEPIE